MARYGRVYKDINENQQRYKIFEANVALIESFNRDTNKAYKLSVNQFADLTNEEFKASRNRFKAHFCSAKTNSFKYEIATTVPSTVDRRRKGAVTPVKDQGQCGKLLLEKGLGPNLTQKLAQELRFSLTLINSPSF